jgi:hypothetical protein
MPLNAKATDTAAAAPERLLRVLPEPWLTAEPCPFHFRMTFAGFAAGIARIRVHESNMQPNSTPTTPWTCFASLPIFTLDQFIRRNKRERGLAGQLDPL